MIVAEDLRTAGCLHAADADIVFDGDRNARERTMIPTLLDLRRTLQRTFTIDLEKAFSVSFNFSAAVIENSTE